MKASVSAEVPTTPALDERRSSALTPGSCPLLAEAVVWADAAAAAAGFVMPGLTLVPRTAASAVVDDLRLGEHAPSVRPPLPEVDTC
jgi:hypothetical protein